MGMDTQTSVAVEPKARRTIFAGFKVAATEMWGANGLTDIGSRLSPPVRRATVEAITVETDFLPESYVLEWYQAVWEGPAGRSRDLYNQFLQRMMDHGFGRIRKFFLQMASAPMIIQKAAELWRHDHNTGDMRFERVDGNTAVVTLAEHAYLTTPIARASVVEIMRYAAASGRNSNVRASYVLESASKIRVTLTWE
jgi:hypothetical protein